MEDSAVFSTSFRGYNYREVDDYIDYAKKVEQELRDGCEVLQKKYDTVCEQLTKVTQERDRAVADCTTLSGALKKLRYDALTHQAEPDDGYKAKYEAAVAELEKLKAKPGSAADGIQATSDMVNEVARVIQKVEADARRKAEALTLAAKLEKAQTALMKARTVNEVRSLAEMLNSFLEKNPMEEAENEEEQ
ncbi:MAG TPA: hypothetical protein DDY98_01155 [Ruminococcaceae bacterium]|nr:hypothetical protein [Oscillospiraceae bacterium]